MGRDKYENEELLKYGFPEDIWFHVDSYSSAHVYLRHLPDPRGFPVEVELEMIPEDVLEECLQLVKANSIEGCKLASVSCCYTHFSNLRKDASMDVGQIGFHNQKRVFHKMVNKDKTISNRVMKRKEEKPINLKEEREHRDRQIIRRERERKAEAELAEKERREKLRKEKEAREYKGFLEEEDMTSNAAMKGKTPQQFIDDFWG
eukprot:MONOS_8641.1-p1 / transcript=MONOS_8641.1 / gene=MONOS_8641 / organism=Monocercomonoides_exilis_PA203 / gene_product=Coiledcoil domain containing protein / transcript_product=Coiledcoil domain containing protein / location=Mono_scaffold00330:61987-62897(-) / protein_length=203 / sequence_SO=supercontig / SO=protein_coding / is_pseudo=false